MKTAVQLIDDIETKSKGLYASMDDSETISRTLFELAILSMGLGNHLIEALDEERKLDSLYKFSIDNTTMKFVQDSQPVNKAELMSRESNYHLKKDWLKAKRNVDVLKIKRADLDKVIDTGRSRLSLIKNDIRKDVA